MRTGITPTSKVRSTGCRGERPTPVVICLFFRTQRRSRIRTRARSVVPPSHAASTLRRLSWSPHGEWQRLLAGPLAGYQGRPRTTREGTTDWLWPVGRVGVRPSRGTPRPNDHLATLPARTLSRPGFGSGRLIPRSGSVARGVAAPRSRAALCLGSGPIVPGAQSWGTHRFDGPDGGVRRLVTPRSPGDPGKGGRTSLLP